MDIKQENFSRDSEFLVGILIGLFWLVEILKFQLRFWNFSWDFVRPLLTRRDFEFSNFQCTYFLHYRHTMVSMGFSYIYAICHHHVRNVEYFVYNTNTPLPRRTPPHHTRRNTKSIVSLYFYSSSKSLFTMTNVSFSPFYTDLCLFICLLKELETEQAKSHWLHLFGFFPLCVFKCFLKLPASEA